MRLPTAYKHSDESLAGSRIPLIDSVRGITMLSMLLFHTAYDLVYICGYSLPFFENPYIQDVWRASISWTFLLIAGSMALCSRNNFKRAIRYAAVSLLLWVVTSIAALDTPISFGIMFCMAASTLIIVPLAPLIKTLRHKQAGICFVVVLIIFACCLPIPYTYYEVAGLSWLGFPDASFSSGDYYPLIPYSLMYGAGALLWHALQKPLTTHFPEILTFNPLPFLAKLGTRSLLIYVFHQPIIFSVCIGMTHIIFASS
ncbi:DUF1624 domain-containing protein [Collinsella sp. zg1085]|uniref:heparan-alpha-glucosaminide N-acetyltransferase n=1 Tax=Collinsella sp. zg1085 TaxID=2844380 RepID=UPI001C0B9154|nr:heparan-alpha-glucosaminide N-acetyltransferase [Collinsella sp. zg1085]QWT17002.1 DUF1624 domain-containing protein [Collinsella sp. zg1085]